MSDVVHASARMCYVYVRHYTYVTIRQFGSYVCVSALALALTQSLTLTLTLLLTPPLDLLACVPERLFQMLSS